MSEIVEKISKKALDYALENQSPDVEYDWFRLYTYKYSTLLIEEINMVLTKKKMYFTDDQIRVLNYHFDEIPDSTENEMSNLNQIESCQNESAES